MVNGKLRCIGSAQHLKDKFGKGYSIRIRLKKDAGKDVKDKIFHFLMDHFPHIILKVLLIML